MTKYEVAENNSIKLNEVVFLLFFVVMFGARAIGLYEGQVAYNVSLIIGIVLFVAKLMLTEHTALEYAWFSGLLLLSLLIYRNTGEKGLFLYMMLMIGMKNVPRKHIEIAGFLILSGSFTILTSLSSLGIIDDRTIEQNRTFFGNVLRHSLGYPHPNTTMTVYIILVMLFFSVAEFKERKWTIVFSTIFIIQSLLLYLFTCSNTGLIVSVIYILINIYMSREKTINRAEKLICYFIYPIGIVVGIILPLMTIKYTVLNDILINISHTRWRLAQYYLLNEPVSLLGVRFKEFIEPETNYAYMIDSSYLYSFMQLGVVGFIVVTSLSMYAIYYLVKVNKKRELAIVVSLCILALSDPFFYNLSFKNLFFLYIGEAVWNTIQTKKEPKFNFINEIDTFLDKTMRWGRTIGNIKMDLCYSFKGCCLNFKVIVSYLVILVLMLFAGLIYYGHFYMQGIPQTVEQWEIVRSILAAIFWALSFTCVLVSFLFEFVERKR